VHALQPPSVEIITTGDELCRGETIDTNSAWLAERLLALGGQVRWMTTIGDPQADIEDALRRAYGRADVVVVSGGLGPTVDDRTAAAAAVVAGVDLALVPEQLERIRERFARMGRTMSPNNEKQAYLPQGSRPLSNDAGTAPGFELRVGAGTGFFLPGVPRELKSMFEQRVVPRLRELFPRRGARAACRLRTFGLGESKVDTLLAGLVEGTAGASIHFRASFPEVHVTLVVTGSDQPLVDETLARLAAEARTRLGDIVYGEGDTTLPMVLHEALRLRGWTLALAESCTGGLGGHLLTELPGASDILTLDVVAYSGAMKRAVLGVQETTLRTHGSYSKECALEMAEGARRLAGSQVGIGITGVAGPASPGPDLPVGTVDVGVVTPQGAHHRRLLAPGSRSMIKTTTAHAAFALALRALQSVEPGGNG
jgi:nicotinamide-nucleotide amidase